MARKESKREPKAKLNVSGKTRKNIDLEKYDLTKDDIRMEDLKTEKGDSSDYIQAYMEGNYSTGEKPSYRKYFDVQGPLMYCKGGIKEWIDKKKNETNYSCQFPLDDGTNDMFIDEKTGKSRYNKKLNDKFEDNINFIYDFVMDFLEECKEDEESLLHDELAHFDRNKPDATVERLITKFKKTIKLKNGEEKKVYDPESPNRITCKLYSYDTFKTSFKWSNGEKIEWEDLMDVDFDGYPVFRFEKIYYGTKSFYIVKRLYSMILYGLPREIKRSDAQSEKLDELKDQEDYDIAEAKRMLQEFKLRKKEARSSSEEQENTSDDERKSKKKNKKRVEHSDNDDEDIDLP